MSSLALCFLRRYSRWAALSSQAMPCFFSLPGPPKLGAAGGSASSVVPERSDPGSLRPQRYLTSAHQSAARAGYFAQQNTERPLGRRGFGGGLAPVKVVAGVGHGLLRPKYADASVNELITMRLNLRYYTTGRR